MLKGVRSGIKYASGATSSRYVWTASTALSFSPKALVQHLVNKPTAKGGSITIFALSKNISPPLLQSIQTLLSQTAPTTVGCLSEVIPSSIAEHLGLAHDPNSESGETYSVSVATFHPQDSSTRVIPFFSSLQGRPNVSLGREIKSGPRFEGGSESSDEGFEAFLSGRSWGFGDDARGKTGESLAGLDGISPGSVKEIVSFTTDRIQPILKSFSSYQAASIAGLVGSSTPFHSANSAPYTLYFNNEELQTGAVGVAIVGAPARRPLTVEYAGLVPLAGPYEVTSSKGNIVLTLSEQNAARLLLTAVQSIPTSNIKNAASMYVRQEEKEKEFFAAVFDSKPGKTINLGSARHISRIMAGDPSRGAMSVDTEEEVKLGSWVVFLHRKEKAFPTPHLLSPSSMSSSTLAFVSVSPSYTSPKSADEVEVAGASVRVIPGFVGASENGVILSRPGNDSWVCGNEGATVSIGP
ncbi:hypothetical protein T439DRAFT_324919 [Meredithblackwellia eburnea MCA 4105]